MPKVEKSLSRVLYERTHRAELASAWLTSEDRPEKLDKDDILTLQQTLDHAWSILIRITRAISEDRRKKRKPRKMLREGDQLSGLEG